MYVSNSLNVIYTIDYFVFQIYISVLKVNVQLRFYRWYRHIKQIVEELLKKGRRMQLDVFKNSLN